MFNLTDKDVIGQTNKLLFNIWKELEKLTESKQYSESIEPDKEQAFIMPKNNLCSFCGKEHTNKGIELACLKKRKKEGAK